MADTPQALWRGNSGASKNIGEARDGAEESRAVNFGAMPTFLSWLYSTSVYILTRCNGPEVVGLLSNYPSLPDLILFMRKLSLQLGRPDLHSCTGQ